MVGNKTHHHASSSLLPKELNLLHKARCSPDDGGGVHGGGGGGRGALGQWKCRLLDSLRPRRPRCVVCLQVQHVTGMPPATKGRGMVVGWRSKDGEGEHTAPARVSCGGAAAFDEVFLHYFTAGGATLQSFTVWAALMDDSARSGGSGDLGAFPVDLAEAESSHRQFGGKTLSFPLGGAAAGAVLTVSVYCRVMEQEEIHGANGHARSRKNKGKSSYASCLPHLSCLRDWLAAAAVASSGSAWPATSLRSDQGGFITIENSVAEMDGGGAFGLVEDDEEGAGFITMELGTISSWSGRAALAMEALAYEEDDEKQCLFMELSEDTAAMALEVEEVEDEFLAILEDKYWADMARTRSKEIDKGLSVGLDLDSLIRDAETELARAEQAWKSKVGAAIVEEEEYKELARAEQAWKSKVGAAIVEEEEYKELARAEQAWKSKVGAAIVEEEEYKELARAEQAWKSKVGAAIVEEEEYKELVRRWGSSTRDRHREHAQHLTPSNSAGCSWDLGFGSPI